MTALPLRAQRHAAAPRSRRARARVRRRVTNLIYALGTVLLVVALFAVPQGESAFTDVTDNPANTFAADTLDPPTNLVASGGATVTLGWTATPDTYADGHWIYRSSSASGPYTQIAQVTPRTNVSYIDTPAVGTYYYVARAFDGSWESVNSNEASAAVAGPPEDYDAVVPASDNCPVTFNINQFDTDGDTIGDACDPSPTVASSGAFTDSGQTLGTVANSFGLAFGDVDGDNDLDAIVANYGQANTVWLNNGTGTFTNSGQTLGTGTTTAVDLGDIDGDGDLDAFLTNYGQANTVWLNNGTGTFTNSGQTLGTANSRATAFGDVDGDNDLDAIVANYGQPNTVWLNNGTGTFTNSGQTLGTANSRGVVFGDVDGDTDLDAMINNGNQPNTVWLNNGSGTFTDSGQTLGSSFRTGLVFGDVDGDGDLDAMSADRDLPNAVWLNNGSGTFTDSGQILGTGSSYGLDFGDIDGDGDLDAFIANDGVDTVWVNNGAGVFADSGQALAAVNSRAVMFGDVDGDGDLDAMVGNFGTPNTVWINDAPAPPADDFDAIVPASDNCPITFNIDQFDTDGDTIGDACDGSPTIASSGVFTDSGQAFGATYSESVAVGDFDADGDLDVTYGNRSGAPNTIWLNDGSGALADSGQALGSRDSEGGAAVGDLDGDGDLDLAYGNFNQPNTIWFNNGAGTFTDSGQTLGSAPTESSALGDFDGDGDLDIAYANDNGQANTIWLNNGTGTFTSSGQTLGNQWSEGMAIGDLDGDTDLDITFANDGNGAGAANTVWLNNGTGTFSNSGQTLGSGPSEGAAVGDFDGDGDLDITYANSTTPNTIWLNNGTGTFVNSGQTLGSADSQNAAAGDFDGDGDLDIAYSNDSQGNTIWLNNGTGTFVNSGQNMGVAESENLAVGDLDGDGDLDITYSNTVSQPNTVWLNDEGPAVGLADSWQAGLSHTSGSGSNRLLVFVASNEQQASSGPSLTGVTYGGQPLTHVVSDEVSNLDRTARLEIWILNEAGIAAAVGTSLSPTWTSGADTPLYSHAVLANVDQVTPTGASTIVSSAGDTPNPVPIGPVSTSIFDMVVVAATAGEVGDYAPQNAFTSGLNQEATTGGTSAHGTGYKAAVGADETASMLFLPGAPPWINRQVVIAVVLNVAP